MVVDKRLNESSLITLNSMIGREFTHFRCDPFYFNNLTHGVVSLFIGEQVYQIQNALEVQPYFGVQEDICNLNVIQINESEAHSMLTGVAQIDIPFNEIISRIMVLNESQHMFRNEQVIDEYYFVRSVVFILSDGREISFDKTDDFSEQIAIRRGHNLIEQVFVPDEDLELEPGFSLQVSRDIQCIN